VFCPTHKPKRLLSRLDLHKVAFLLAEMRFTTLFFYEESPLLLHRVVADRELQPSEKIGR